MRGTGFTYTLRSGWFLPLVLFALNLLHFSADAADSNVNLRIGITEKNLPGSIERVDVVPRIQRDLLQEIARREGWNLQYTDGTTATNQRRLLDGEIDILLPAYPGTDSAGGMVYNREAVLSTWGLIYTGSNSDVHSLLDLNGKVVAVAEGDAYFREFEETVRRFNIDTEFILVRSYAQVFHAIDKNHVDAGIVERTYGLLNAEGYHVKSTPIIFTPTEVHFASNSTENLQYLDTIDYYLALYKRDQNSIYYKTLENYLGSKAHPLPKWVKTGIYLSGLVLLILLVILLIQRREVISRRAELDKTSRELDDQIEKRKGQEADLLRFGMVVEQMVEGVFITDIHGIVRYVNPAFEELAGLAGVDIVGQSFHFLLHGSDKEQVIQDIDKSLGNGESWKYRFAYKRSDGGEVEVEGTVSPVRNGNGETMNYLSIVRNISHEVRLEEQLRQSQKLEAIGTLAGGIAHDFNNTLFAMMGYTDLVLATLPEADSRKEMLNQVLQAGTRAKELIQQILTFSRKSDQTLRVLELQPLVKETLKLIRPTMPANITIKTEFDAAGVLVRSDPTQIHQVVMNLCSNAAYAMENLHGTLAITLSSVTVDSTLTQKVSGLVRGRYIRLTIEDTGYGIDRAVLDRIFEPFFTTKPNGKGTGMGLAVVHGIVLNHDGAIDVSSEVGSGTRFDIYLPRVVGAAEKEQSIQKEYPTGSERVLVVDDETAVADTMRRMLEHLGYDVNAFVDSRAAFHQFSTKPGEFDLLVTDLSMPGMSGMELAQACNGVRKDLPILMVTGYGQDISNDALASHGICELISKPVLTGDMAMAVRRLLDDSSTRRNGQKHADPVFS